MNYSELLQLAKGWGNFVSDRINIWRLPNDEHQKGYLTECFYRMCGFSDADPWRTYDEYLSEVN